MSPKVYLGSGWNAYDTILAPGDVSGDGLPDLLARDRSGVLWLYPGNGHGGFGTRHLVGSGWQMYNALVVVGDQDGHGYNQLIGRLPNGQIYRYTSNGHGGFGPRKAIGGNRWLRYASLS